MKFGPSPFTYDVVMGMLSTSGLEFLSSFPIAKHVEHAVQLGFTHFDLALDIFQTFPIPILESEIDKLHQLKLQYNVTYSCHLPYYSLDLAGPNEFMREGSRKALVNAYQSVQKIEQDIECYVVHPIGENTTEILSYIGDTPVKPVAVELFKQNSIQSIQAFLEDTKISPNKLALENLEYPLEPTLDIVRETGTRFCLDTAHLLGNLSGKWDLCQVLLENYDLIAEIHLQDYNFNNPMNDHAALGTSGRFPLDFVDLLISKDFRGPIVFELIYDDISESCRFLRKHYPRLKDVPQL